MSARPIWISFVALAFVLNLFAESPARPARNLIVVGGGKVSDEMRKELLTLAGVEKPHVLIIPQAAREENFADRGRDNAEAFRRVGAAGTSILDLSDPKEALESIKRADAFWMPGGVQRQLMQALDDAGVADAIRARVAAGTPVGGSSAGAAIMSEVMLSSSRRDEGTGAPIPVIGRGLGFWSEVIVDQHFTQRSRLDRLKAALTKHPELLGVGIDEDTAVVFDGKRFRVMGDHAVTVLQVKNPDSAEPVFHSLVLQPGDTYDIASRSATFSAHPFERIQSAPAVCNAVVPELMQKWKVPGVSIAAIRNHKLSWTGQYGIKTVGKTEKVEATTIFEAASMSKPVFAYVVLQLAQEGLLDLDQPLVEILGKPYIETDDRHKRITARMVLTHTSGFPNWRPGGSRSNGPIPIHFEPGTQMRYSGEGFLFLQRAVEKLTGMPLNDLVQQRLFQPLGMTNSSYVWR
ncbi:MAG: cyanophycinase, partial [Limisphaerales bacterium]